MADDLGGYFNETAYPSMLHLRMTPGALAAMARRNGWAAPDPRGAFRLLDIGCGDGLGLAVTAASHPEAQFEGIDGMAEHVSRGQAFGDGLGNLDLRHALFGDASEQDGPPCDFVVMHGVIAWVPPEARAQALDLAARRLGPGGICAVSYNAMPGWANRLAYQHLLTLFARAGSGIGADRFLAAHRQVSAMAEIGLPGLDPKSPKQVADLFDEMPPDYFPHEYLNADWQPLWGADVRAAMAARGLTYLGQAAIDRTRPDLTLKPAQRDAIDAVGDAALRDSLEDIARDSQFRIDLYGRDPATAAQGAFDATWLATDHDPEAELVARSQAGTLRFDNPAARGILKALQDGPARVDTLADRLGFGMADIRNATDCLLLGRLVFPCVGPGATEAARDLNRALSAQALTPEGPAILALAGAHGPVPASKIEIGLLHTSVENLMSAARRDPAIRDRFFRPDARLDDPELHRKAEATRTKVLHRLARLGVLVGKT